MSEPSAKYCLFGAGLPMPKTPTFPIRPCDLTAARAPGTAAPSIGMSAFRSECELIRLVGCFWLVAWFDWP